MHGVLVFENGKWFVWESRILHAHPVELKISYPAEIMEMPRGPGTAEGMFLEYRDRGVWAGERGLKVWTNPNAEGKILEERQIPRPKVRAGVEVRWYDMERRWEKLTRKGWVPA
jgi:hypothetical protein